MSLATSLGVAAVSGATLLLAGGVIFARKVTAISTRRKDTLPIAGWHEGAVELAATRETMAPGIFSLYTNQGAGHCRVGQVVGRNNDNVVREIQAVYRPAQPGTAHGYWSGYGYENPGDLGLVYREVQIPVARGAAPAWLLDGDTQTWVIHIHGLGGRRAACLRSVPIFDDLRASQLIVSYAGDQDAPAFPDGRHHLGLDEWHDVDAAVDFAVRAGATSVVLSVWSMGATIALQLLQKSRHRTLISGIVMTAPVLDWEQTLIKQGRLARVPKVVAQAGMALMADTRLYRLVGLSGTLAASAGSWFSGRPATVPPLLVLHAPQDPLAMYSQSERLAEVTGARLISVDAPGHTLEWSVAPARCSEAVRHWWRHDL